MIDDRILLDCGSMTRGLSVEEQLRIDHIFVSHAHLDHVRDLGLLADNIFARRSTPVDIWCSEACAEGLTSSYFNNLLWPNFFKIPNPTDKDGNGMLRLNIIADGTTVTLGAPTNGQSNGTSKPQPAYELKTVTVDHSIECQSAFLTDSTGATLVYSGDTGPTERLWPEINAVPDLRGFIFEVSFPNDMEELAKVSGHLTPKLMYEQLEKFAPKNEDAPIFIYGLKPGYHERLKTEIAELGDERLKILKPMDEFEL